MNKFFENKLVQVVTAGTIMLGLHHANYSLPRDWTAWAFATIPLIIIMITAVARAQDIEGKDLRSFTRRMGFILAGAGAFSLLLAPILGYGNSYPSWRAVTLYWGFALTWLTTPHMPPWWKYISGEWRIKRGEDV